MTIATTATEALKLLWKNGFFKDWRKQAEIVDELHNLDNHFPTADLGMALKRAEHLTRRGNRGSYEYIQKHKFIDSSQTGN